MFVNTCPDDAITIVKDHKSCTMPDQSTSIKELLERFAFVDGISVGELQRMSQAKGYAADQSEESLWETPDLDGLDIAELQELADAAGEKIAAYKAQQERAALNTPPAKAGSTERSEVSLGSDSD